jgi:hypothetical protein
MHVRRSDSTCLICRIIKLALGMRINTYAPVQAEQQLLRFAMELGGIGEERISFHRLLEN